MGLYQNIPVRFLALLAYVSRAHEIKIRPSVRRPSVARLWHRLSLNLSHGFLSYFISYTRTFFLILNKKKTLSDFIQIFFFFVNMGFYGSQNFKTLPFNPTFESF